jgi:hypothetical protein
MTEKEVDTFCGGCHVHVPPGHEDRTRVDYDGKRWHKKCHDKHIQKVLSQALRVNLAQLSIQ